MRALTSVQLLELWEQGARLPPTQRALLLLGAACPDETSESLGELSLGRRDARLLRLREAAFGARIEATAACPECHEKLELSFNANDLLSGDEGEGGTSDDSRPLRCECDGHAIVFRLPNSRDVLEVSAEADAARAQSLLLRRCVTQARRGDVEIAADDLPATLVELLEVRMAAADPNADLQLALTCPSCRHAWVEAFDVIAFFWREIETWALALLRDIHAIAQAYGWSEREIVALTPQRRRLYLEMIGA